MYLILDHLEFNDLLSMAQINDKYSSLAADAYRYTFSRIPIYIENGFRFPDDPKVLLNMAGMKMDAKTLKQINMLRGHGSTKLSIVSKTEIYIRDGNQILDLFKHFGHFIKSIKSRMYKKEQPLEAELIGKLISKFSSETLLDIEFIFDAEKMLGYITKPLISVETMTFRNNDVSLKNQTISEVLPALRRLNLHALSDDGLAYFDHHMPHLEHVTMEELGITLNKAAPLPGVIVKNPQIKSIDLQNFKHEFLKKVNTQMPQLETLRISHYVSDESIRFENVTTFIDAGAYFSTSITNFYFPRIHTFRLVCCALSIFNMGPYFAFFDKHKHLKHLHLDNLNGMDDTKFQQLTKNLDDIVELTLDHKFPNYALSDNVILEFLASHDNVKQLNVYIPEHREDELRELLKHEWDIRTNGAGLSFVRKTNA